MEKRSKEEFIMAVASGINEYLRTIRGARQHAEVVVETQPEIRLVLKLPAGDYQLKITDC